MNSNLSGVFCLLLIDFLELQTKIIHLLIQQLHFILEGVFDYLGLGMFYFSELGHFLHLFVHARHFFCSFCDRFLVCDVFNSGKLVVNNLVKISYRLLYACQRLSFCRIYFCLQTLEHPKDTVDLIVVLCKIILMSELFRRQLSCKILRGLLNRRINNTR